jgi:hypothetical protein
VCGVPCSLRKQEHVGHRKHDGPRIAGSQEQVNGKERNNFLKAVRKCLLFYIAGARSAKKRVFRIKEKKDCVAGIGFEGFMSGMVYN